MRRDVSFDRLRERQNHFRARRGFTKEQLVIGIAKIPRLEQHCRSVGTAKDMESGKAMRFRAKLDSARRLADQPRGEIG